MEATKFECLEKVLLENPYIVYHGFMANDFNVWVLWNPKEERWYHTYCTMDIIETELRKIELSDDLGSIDDIAVSEDGSFSIPDKDIPKLIRLWDNFHLLEGIDDFDTRRILAYNLSMVAIYSYLCEPKEECCGIPIMQTLVAIVREVIPKEKLANPKKLWDFYVEWIKDHVDVLDRIRNNSYYNIGVEAEMCNMFSETLRKILFRKDELEK